MLCKVCLGHGTVGSGKVGWGEANNVPWHLHLVCVAVSKYAATLADVVNVREHKFHGIFIFLLVKLAHAVGDTLASRCCGQRLSISVEF